MKYQKPQTSKVKLYKKGGSNAPTASEMAPTTPKEATFEDASYVNAISRMAPIAATSVNTGAAPATINTNAQTYRPMSFGEAFAAARKAGLQVFDWNGKKFGTQLAGQPKPATPAVKGPVQGPPNQSTVPSPFVKPAPAPPTFINGPGAWKNTPGSGPIPAPAPAPAPPVQQIPPQMQERIKYYQGQQDFQNRSQDAAKRAHQIVQNREANAKAGQKAKEHEAGAKSRAAMTNGVPTGKNKAASFWERQQAANEKAYQMTHKNY